MVVRAPRTDRVSTQLSTQVTVATAEELAATGERSLPRMIGAATGVWIQETNLGGGSPFIHGLTGNQVLLVIDGVRINDSTTRFGPNQNLNGIDPSIVERVEVVRGPASVLYGSDAIGGVVSIWTRSRFPSTSRGEQGLRAELRASLQSQTDGLRASMNVSDAGEDVGWFLSGSYQRWNDLEAGDGETQDFTGYDGGELFGSATFELGDRQLLRWSSRYHRDNDVPRTDKLVPGFPTAVGGPPTAPSSILWRFAEQEYLRHQLTYTDRVGGDFADENEWRLSFRRAREVRERIDVSNLDRFRRESDQVLTVGLAADWKKDLDGQQRLTWGFDADLDDIDSGRTNTTISTGAVSPADGRFPPDADYLRLGAFIQDEIVAFDPFDVTVGLRYSRYDFDFDPLQSDPVGLPVSGGGEGDFDQLTASLAVAGDVSERLRIGGTLAQGFRAPNLADLSQVNTFGGGIEVGNPDLEAEQSLYGELAADYYGERFDLGLAVFHNDISDVITREFDAQLTADYLAATGETDGVFQLVNRDKVTVWGVDLRTRVRFGDDSPWSVEGNVAYQRGQQYSDDPASNDLPYRRIPPLHGRVTLDWAPLSRIGSSLERVRFLTTFADDQSRLAPGDISDPRIDPDGTPGWVVFGLGFDGRLGVWGGRWSLLVDNLLDKNYRVHGSGFDAPGFGATLALEWSF